MEAAGDTEAEMMISAAQHTMLNNMLETLVIPTCFLVSWATLVRTSTILETSRSMSKVCIPSIHSDLTAADKI
jgi:hypothetical protein